MGTFKGDISIISALKDSGATKGLKAMRQGAVNLNKTFGGLKKVSTQLREQYGAFSKEMKAVADSIEATTDGFDRLRNAADAVIDTVRGLGKGANDLGNLLEDSVSNPALRAKEGVRLLDAQMRVQNSTLRKLQDRLGIAKVRFAGFVGGVKNMERILNLSKAAILGVAGAFTGALARGFKATLDNSKRARRSFERMKRAADQVFVNLLHALTGGQLTRGIDSITGAFENLAKMIQTHRRTIFDFAITSARGLLAFARVMGEAVFGIKMLAQSLQELVRSGVGAVLITSKEKEIETLEGMLSRSGGMQAHIDRLQKQIADPSVDPRAKQILQKQVDDFRQKLGNRSKHGRDPAGLRAEIKTKKAELEAIKRLREEERAAWLRSADGLERFRRSVGTLGAAIDKLEAGGVKGKAPTVKAKRPEIPDNIKKEILSRTFGIKSLEKLIDTAKRITDTQRAARGLGIVIDQVLGKFTNLELVLERTRKAAQAAIAFVKIESAMRIKGLVEGGPASLSGRIAELKTNLEELTLKRDAVLRAEGIRTASPLYAEIAEQIKRARMELDLLGSRSVLAVSAGLKLWTDFKDAIVQANQALFENIGLMAFAGQGMKDFGNNILKIIADLIRALIPAFAGLANALFALEAANPVGLILATAALGTVAGVLTSLSNRGGNQKSSGRGAREFERAARRLDRRSQRDSRAKVEAVTLMVGDRPMRAWMVRTTQDALNRGQVQPRSR